MKRLCENSFAVAFGAARVGSLSACYGRIIAMAAPLTAAQSLAPRLLGLGLEVLVG